MFPRMETFGTALIPVLERIENFPAVLRLSDEEQDQKPRKKAD